MQMTLIYIHGQYGSPEEAEHYRALLPGWEVIGFDYKAQTPWEAEREFVEYFDGLAEGVGGDIGIIANSIGAFYAMCALSGRICFKKWDRDVPEDLLEGTAILVGSSRSIAK